MPLDFSIAEPRPSWLSSTPSGGDIQLAGANFSTSMTLYIMSWLATDARDLYDHWFPTGSGIHARARTDIVQPTPAGHLYLANPIGYGNSPPSQIIQDLAVHQARVSHLRHIITVTADEQTTNWTTSDLGGNFFQAVNQGVATFDHTEANQTATLGAKLILGAVNTLPSNVVRIREIRLNMWVSFEELGTAAGHYFDCELYVNATAGAPASGNVLGKQKITDKIATVGDLWRFVQLRWKSLDLAKADIEKMQIELDPQSGFVGGGPSSKWFVSEVDIELFCTVDDRNIIDEATFENLDTYFTAQTPSYHLTGDFVAGETYAEAAQDILAHAPELVLYTANDGQLSMLKWPKYADEVSPYTIGPEHGNYISVEDTYDEAERLITEAQYNYGVTRPDSGAASPGFKVFNNKANYLHLLSESNRYKERPDQDITEVDREWFTDEDVTGRHARVTEALHGLVVPVVIVKMNRHIFVPEIGSIVALDIDDIDYVDKKLIVVGKHIDLDEMEGNLICVDREYIDPDT